MAELIELPRYPRDYTWPARSLFGHALPVEQDGRVMSSPWWNHQRSLFLWDTMKRQASFLESRFLSGQMGEVLEGLVAWYEEGYRKAHGGQSRPLTPLRGMSIERRRRCVARWLIYHPSQMLTLNEQYGVRPTVGPDLRPKLTVTAPKERLATAPSDREDLFG